MRSSFVYVRTECIHCIKLLINIYFLEINYFFITNFFVRIFFALTVYVSILNIISSQIYLDKIKK